MGAFDVEQLVSGGGVAAGERLEFYALNFCLGGFFLVKLGLREGSGEDEGGERKGGREGKGV